MSGTLPANEPLCVDARSDTVELVLEAQQRDLGGFGVRRVLPSVRRRRVGPFAFFDHIGPAELAKGSGIDVRPHPHIGLATVTYLFEGELDHRDSLGTLRTIRPGDVNWMVAGRGIVHSERSPQASRARGSRIHGIQIWVALPLEHEETEPCFEHHPEATLPLVEHEGVTLRVVAGEAYGVRSPVGVLSPTLYVDARLDRGARLALDDGHEARAVYVVEGAIACARTLVRTGSMAIVSSGNVELESVEAARVVLIGGGELAGERYVHWNFVSSSKERIERAKNEWVHGLFPRVPGDELEYIPLPEHLNPSGTTA